MNRLDELHAVHEQAEDLFAHSENTGARDELAQCLCTTRTAIFVLESGGSLTELDIQEAIEHAREKIAAAMEKP